MTGFKAEADKISSAGTQMTSAAGEVKGADPSGSVGDIGSALPGSQSAAAANKLASAWSKRFQGWRDDGVAQGEKMRTSAANYDASDHQAAIELRLLMRHTGETY